ncbi:MAG: 3-deoxy-manno-octulosonate cytidylyltransferase [Ignavibacteriae bacterium HGW-Ignavibacteriae-2]|jgi:3-deoxy-manno-octulosonate cytidylyltransferase (CMP-KDO synthetase)|nr:MAG: 3-deoxy-manno-octulosonate cytidylyltransferase [Ignavibacteriae bacterium HGW-Ignavibacteriae-2]
MIIGIIPARFASTRLMGKPLADIGGKPMIQHTYESALKSKLLKKVVIAVDDEKLLAVAKGFGAEAYMTPKELPSGSDRIAYVAKQLSAEIIVNIQGDEPFIQGKMIDQAIEPLLFDKKVQVSTLVKKIDKYEELKSTSIPKVVFDYNNFALYFSRAPIPHVRDAKTNLDRVNMADVYKHIGLYVYRKNALLNFTQMPPTDLEQIEKLEQLRMLENGIKIKVVITEFESLSVDTPKDLEIARKYYEKYVNLK